MKNTQNLKEPSIYVSESNINYGDILKVICSIVLLAIFGFFITIKEIPYAVTDLITQIFLFILFVCFFSYKTYYLRFNDEEAEFIEKFGIFLIIFLPFALIFLTQNFIQTLSFFISLVVTVRIFIAYYLKNLTNKVNVVLLFILHIWSLLSILMLLKDLDLIPSELFLKLNFLSFKAIQNIRIILGCIYIIILAVSSIIIGLKSNVIWKPLSLKQIPYRIITAGIPEPLKLILGITQTITKYLINGLIINLFINIIFLGIIRISIDILLRIIYELVRKLYDLFKKSVSILYFVFMYIIALITTYTLFLTSDPFIKYLRGDEQKIGIISLYFGIIILLSIIQKIFIVNLFTNHCNRSEARLIRVPTGKTLSEAIKEYDETYKVVERKIDTPTFPYIIKDILFSTPISLITFALLVYIASGILILLSQIFTIPEFSTWGYFTKYFTFILIPLVIISIYIGIKSKNRKDDELVEEEWYYEFKPYSWNESFSEWQLYYLFTFVVILSFFI